MYSIRHLVLVVVSAVVKASGINIDGNSGDGAPKAGIYCLQPRSGNTCYDEICSFGPTSDVKMGNVLHSQQPVLQISSSRHASYLYSCGWNGYVDCSFEDGHYYFSLVYHQ